MTGQPQLDLDRRNSATSAAALNVSVIILSYNEETNLPGCLESLRGLESKIFVVDSFSTDRTPEIAKTAGVVFIQHAFENYSAQPNWSQENLPIGTPWVLHLDADERLTPELVTEINHILSNPPIETAGFLLRKRTIFMGRWIRHGGHYPSYHLRLFRVGFGRCEDRLYDQHFVVESGIKRMKHDYIDVVASTISSWTLRHARWAGMEAREMVAVDARRNQIAPELLGNPIQRRRWWR